MTPPNPFNLNLMYLHHLGGGGKSFQVQHYELAVASPKQLLLAGQAWLRGLYPSPHHTPSLLFPHFPFSFC